MVKKLDLKEKAMKHWTGAPSVHVIITFSEDDIIFQQSQLIADFNKKQLILRANILFLLSTVAEGTNVSK